MADYIKQIRNCLALAESSNENEARDALLTARRLMAKYKISEAEIMNADDQKVIKKLTGIDYSVRRDPWTAELARTIAEYHCCRSYQARQKGHSVAEIGFIGLSDDFSVCMEIFMYAIDCVRSKTKKLKKTHNVKVANGYGYGFVVGLSQAYEKQQTEEGWGLVLVASEAVNNVANNMKQKKQSEKPLKEANAIAFRNGIKDGRKFHEQKRIKGKE